MKGEPCIRSLHLKVHRVLEAMATYSNRAALKREYSEHEDEDNPQVVAFADSSLNDNILPPVVACCCFSTRACRAPPYFTCATRAWKPTTFETSNPPSAIAGGAYVATVCVAMYASLGIRSQTCQRTARLRHPPIVLTGGAAAPVLALAF
jgi:hypothetical protein